MTAKRLSLILLISATLVVVAACSPNPEEIGRNVQQSMQQTLSTDENFAKYEIKVLKVVVIKEAGNTYQGMATVRTKRGTEKQVPVQVTADGSNVLWKVEPGTFLFVAQEELGSLFGR